MKKWNKIMMIGLTGWILISPMSVSALSKNETVYTSLNPNGQIKMSSVTNHLLINEKKEFEDDTELKNILNINGKESFTLKDNLLTWKANGKDIFYQGQTEKEQPIEFEIKYYLNEEEKPYKEMIGKKGSVKIIISVKNKLNQEINIGGKNETIYTPFVVTTGMLLDNKYNKNVVVENGKWIDSGSRSMVIGLASPGLYESFNIEEFKNLNQITISYETTKFSLGNMYFVATPKILEEKDLKIFQQVSDVTSNMDVLQKSINQIEEGAKKLEVGGVSILNGAVEINTNLNNAKNAVTALKNGSIELEKGITQLLTSLNQVEVGLKTKVETSSNELIKLKTANNMAIAKLFKPLGNVTFDQLALKYQDTITLTTVIDPADPEATLKTAYQFALLLKQNNMAIDQTTQSLNEIGNTIEVMANAVKPLEAIHTLSEGLTSLEAGIESLANGTASLVSGSRNLSDGITNLNNGIQKFNKEGISTLYYYSNVIQKYNNKLEAMANLSRQYHGYTTSSADNTMFIYTVKSFK